MLRRCEMRFCAWQSALRRVDGEAVESALGLSGVNSGSAGAGGGGERGVCGVVKEDVAEVKGAEGEGPEDVRGAGKEDVEGGVGVRGRSGEAAYGVVSGCEIIMPAVVESGSW